MDALAYADMTTGPTGLGMSVEDRLAEILERYGPGRPDPSGHQQGARRPGERGSTHRNPFGCKGCRSPDVGLRTVFAPVVDPQPHRWVDVEVVQAFERDEPDLAGL